MATHYLNTDLELDSREDLTPIVEEFGDDVVCLYNGPWGTHRRAAFELAANLPHDPDPNSCIRMFCALVAGLSPHARAIWDGCSRRTLDMGFEAGTDRESCQQMLEYDALAQLAAIRTHLVITVYPAE